MRRKCGHRSCLPLDQKIQQGSKEDHVIQTEILSLVAVRS